MKILLVSNGIHHILSNMAVKKIDIVNNDALAMCDVQNYIMKVNPAIEGILITDEALTPQMVDNKHNLLMLLEWISKSNNPKVRVIVLTKYETIRRDLHSLSNRYETFSIITSDLLRVSSMQYKQAYEALLEKGSKQAEPIPPTRRELSKPPIEEPEKRRSFLDRFRSKPKPDNTIEATDRLTRDIENISRGISRVVAVTGHRGNGLTSTAVNIAYEASKRGLSTIIVDMDTEYRSMNMYFSRFHEQSQQNEEVNASLIRSLARPQDYMSTAVNLKDNLWLMSLGYNFHDKKLLEQFYTNSKLIGLLSVLRTKFNLVILDMPLDLFTTFKESMIHMDMFGLCLSNNLHSILNTLRNVEVVLDEQGASFLNAKSKLIITKYNDRSRFQGDIFTAQKVSGIMTSGLSDYIKYEMNIAGNVPYSHDFDSQIETDVPIVTSNADYENAYGHILLRLMEGVK